MSVEADLLLLLSMEKGIWAAKIPATTEVANGRIHASNEDGGANSYDDNGSRDLKDKELLAYEYRLRKNKF